MNIPIFPPSRLIMQSQGETGPTDMVVDRSTPTAARFTVSPQGRDASPMSVASTIPADFDPTLPVFPPLPDYSRPSRLFE